MRQRLWKGDSICPFSSVEHRGIPKISETNSLAKKCSLKILQKMENYNIIQNYPIYTKIFKNNFRTKWVSILNKYYRTQK